MKRLRKAKYRYLGFRGPNHRQPWISGTFQAMNHSGVKTMGNLMDNGRERQHSDPAFAVRLRP